RPLAPQTRRCVHSEKRSFPMTRCCGPCLVPGALFLGYTGLPRSWSKRVRERAPPLFSWTVRWLNSAACKGSEGGRDDATEEPAGAAQSGAGGASRGDGEAGNGRGLRVGLAGGGDATRTGAVRDESGAAWFPLPSQGRGNGLGP